MLLPQTLTFLNVVGEGLWPQLPLPWSLGAWKMKGESGGFEEPFLGPKHRMWGQ